jgi:salicylate hydroxylase
MSGERRQAATAIAIAGAGIAGLSAAIALKSAGFHVAVYEREPTLEAIGAGIQVGSNATRIMEGWGLDFEGEACEPASIELRNARSGALLNSVPLGATVRWRYGAPYLTLSRANLQQALLKRVQELGIPVSFGSEVTKAAGAGGGVVLEAGGKSIYAAALVGADGINSKLRGLLGPMARRFSAQAVAWRGFIPLGAIPAPLRNAIGVWMAPGAHLVHYPVLGGAKHGASLIVDDIYRSDGLQGNGAAYLAGRVTDWAPVPRSIMLAARSWLPWRIFCVEKWAGGTARIQTVGDAWHAMRPYLASGAVMAVEDAHALAQCLTETGGKVELGLRLFRERRAPRVWRVASASARMGRVYNCPQPFDRIRDLSIAALTGVALLSLNDWLYGSVKHQPNQREAAI